MDIETLATELERTIQKSKERSKYFTQEIQRLQFEKRETEKKFQDKIDGLKQNLLDSLGLEETVETDSFIVSKNYPNTESQTTYKLEFPTDKELNERLIQYFKNYDVSLIKEDITYKPIQKNIKQLIIEGQFHISDNGFLVDNNGEIIPDMKVTVKKVEPKVKVKKTSLNNKSRHEN